MSCEKGRQHRDGRTNAGGGGDFFLEACAVLPVVIWTGISVMGFHDRSCLLTYAGEFTPHIMHCAGCCSFHALLTDGIVYAPLLCSAMYSFFLLM